MNWIEITVEFAKAPADWSVYIDLLRDAGCPNVQELDNPPSLIGCIGDGPNAQALAETTGNKLVAAGATDFRTRMLADEDWANAFKEHFKPRRIGSRFVVVPTWDTEFAAESDELVITLDPGQAFGTGDHPTTRMCLELLELAEVADKRVADVGCGTGILAIGAVLLGAREVAAIDIDEASIEVARANASQNDVTFGLEVADGLESLGEGWDVVVSNIISATLVGLAPSAALALVTHGKWIVSGVIHENWPDVLKAAERVGFVLDRKLEDPQWVAAMFQRV